jgi:hypothetical protein
MNALDIFLVAVIIASFFAIIMYYLGFFVKKKKTLLKMEIECDRKKQAAKLRNFIDFFWAKPERFWWISIYLLFMIALGIAIGKQWSYTMSVFFSFITIGFMIFARKSYLWFPARAKKRLEDFENAIREGIKKEISFEGDNIQCFAANDPEFHTEPQIFAFKTGVKKCKFPPLETNPKKQPVVEEQKLEFLILSREYFSICKEATPFSLLEPKRAPVMKGCDELRKAGECHEYYYSQMQNVQYDAKKECIKIIYNTGHEDVEFPCKKLDPNRKPAMKALKEKLRLTERQKLNKVAEHKHYEDLKEKRQCILPLDNKKNNDDKKEEAK